MKNKFLTMLLSLVIAFGLWLYVITTVSPGSEDTYYNIPVAMVGETVLTERGMMITDISSQSVTMTLSGNRSDLVKVNSGNISLKADLSQIYEPGSQIQLGYTTSFPGDLPNNAFVIQSQNPGYIYVTVERRVTKDVPVEVQYIGSAPEGYMTDRDSSSLDVTSVSASGPESILEQIEKALIQVDLTDQRESLSQSFRYTLCDGEGNPVNAELVTTNVEEVRLDLRIQKIKDIELVCNIAPGGGATEDNVTVTLSSNTIRVSGSEAVIDALGDQLVVGTINLRDLPTATKLTFPINLPEGVVNRTGLTEVEADVQFKGLTTRNFVLENIRSVNVPEGLTVDIITEKLTVVVRGLSEKMTELTADDIIATVDFSTAEVGTTTFQVIITFRDGITGVGELRCDPVSASVTQDEEA